MPPMAACRAADLHRHARTRRDVSDAWDLQHRDTGATNESVIYRSLPPQWNPFKGERTIARSSAAHSRKHCRLPRGGWGSYSPDGKQLAYTRVSASSAPGSVIRGGRRRNLALRVATQGYAKLTVIWRRHFPDVEGSKPPSYSFPIADANRRPTSLFV